MSSLPRLRTALGRLTLTPFAYLAAMLLLPLLAGLLNAGVKYSALSALRPVPALSGPLPAPPAYDPAKKIAVVVAGNDGAVVSDFLPTYDILARSGRFNVYAIAPQRRALPLLGLSNTGLTIAPHYSFAGYQAAFGRAPDLIAVPYLPRYSARRDAAILHWLRAETGPHTTVLGICAGTAIVADAGLLDGHRATTNTGWFATVEKEHPAVRWLHNVRYVDDGRRVTSTNLTAGMDATLHVVDRVAGRAVALDVIRQIGYPTTRYLDDPRWLPYDTTAMGPLVVNGAFRWGWERLGPVLHPGVDELSLAGWADPYTSSAAVQVASVAPTWAPIRAQHGLYVVPDYAATSAPHFDRLLAPSSGASQWAYGAALQDLAHDQGDAVATATGRLLFLATAPGERISMGFALAPLLGAATLTLLGAGLVYGLVRLRHRLRTTRPSRLRSVASGTTRFVLHFGEMVVAMYVGMFALGALNAGVLVPLVHVDLTSPTPETQALAMGAFMGLPMAAWMLIRGHGRRHAIEMAAAMIVPFAVAVALHLVGLLPRGAMMEVGSDLMWVVMVGVMLPHWRHYAGADHAHGAPAAVSATLASAR